MKKYKFLTILPLIAVLLTAAILPLRISRTSAVTFEDIRFGEIGKKFDGSDGLSDSDWSAPEATVGTAKPEHGQGKSVFFGAAAPADNNLAMRKILPLADAIDITSEGNIKDTLGLAFWLYIGSGDSLAALKNSDKNDTTIDLGNGTAPTQTSAGNWNNVHRIFLSNPFEAVWNNFVIGWNEIVIKVDRMTGSNGTPDLTAIRALRIRFSKLPNITGSTLRRNYSFGLNDVRFAEIDQTESVVLERTEANTQPPASTGKNVAIADTSVFAGWGGSAKGIIAEGVETGKKSVYLESGRDMNIICSFSAADISGINMKNAALTFWMYVNDASHLTANGQFELNSSGKIDDNNEIKWNYADIAGEITSGKWNKIALSIIPQDLPATNTVGNVDMRALNYLRFYNISGKDYPDGFSMKVLISDLKVEEVDKSGFSKKETVVQVRDYEGREPSSDLLELNNGVGAGKSEVPPVVVAPVVDTSIPKNINKENFWVWFSAVVFAVGILAGGAVVLIVIIGKRKKQLSKKGII